MAESQEFFDYTADILAAIEGTLSPARLGPYLSMAGGDRALALQYYLWNARLAKAFLFPLQIAEVAMRNAMYRALALDYGADWLIEQPFALTPESRQSLDRALVRLPLSPKNDQIVAALTFDFWSNLFRREYDALWTEAMLNATFTNLPGGTIRRDVQQLVATINRFRNRIAHHEPIHQAAHRDELTRILTLVGYCSGDTEDWVRKHSTVMAIVRSPPTSATSRPGRPLASTNLRTPAIFAPNDVLATVLSQVSVARPPVALIVTETGLAAVTAASLARYIGDRAILDGGMIDLTDHDMTAVLQSTAPIPTATVARSGSTGDVTHLFFPPNTPAKDRPQVVVVLDDRTGTPAGILIRPDIRY